jgi:cytochrome P450
MRLYPPGYIIGRRAIVDDEIDGYHIPAGTSIYLAPYATHRNPAYWDNPLSYNPARFSDAGTLDRPNTAFLPFGAGPRVCMGAAFAQMEMQLIIATVAQQFRLSYASNAPAEPSPLVTIRPKAGMPMHAERVG